MTNAINLSRGLFYIMSNDSNLTNMVDSKYMKPLVADNGTPYPFIVYTREGVNPTNGTKDGYIGDYVQFRIDIVSDRYTNALDIAQRVRELFERPIVSMPEQHLQLVNCTMSGINESWDSDAYIQQLRFTATARNYIAQQ